MIPGPTIIKKCSECSGLIQEHSIISGNSVGAQYWTDGKRELPMLPDQPWLVKCPHCQNLLWIDELEEIRESELWKDLKFPKSNNEQELQDYFAKLKSKSYNEPELQDYFAKLKSNNLSSKKILYIRTRAWWKGNDVRRTNDILEEMRKYWKNLPDKSSKKAETGRYIERNSIPKEKLILSDEERNNLQMLYDILNSSDDDLLMKAEIKRELGQFEDAEDILKHRFDEEYSQYYSVIKKLVEKRDPIVAKM